MHLIPANHSQFLITQHIRGLQGNTQLPVSRSHGILYLGGRPLKGKEESFTIFRSVFMRRRASLEFVKWYCAPLTRQKILTRKLHRAALPLDILELSQQLDFREPTEATGHLRFNSVTVLNVYLNIP